MLQQAAIAQLQCLSNVLHQIKDEDYILPLATLKGSSIGMHVRHIVEFYKCVLFDSTNNTINYDERKRNLLLENNVKYTVDFITEIIDVLQNIDTNKRVLLVAVYGNENVTMESSLYRELTYNIEHTVHHLAIISIALPIHFGYIITTENFGYADSTIQYLKTQKAS
jgi:hypothetical protein